VIFGVKLCQNNFYEIACFAFSESPFNFYFLKYLAFSFLGFAGLLSCCWSGNIKICNF
jgi:hypothetical protein